jgi:hypothetical protein
MSGSIFYVVPSWIGVLQKNNPSKCCTDEVFMSFLKNVYFYSNQKKGYR